MAKGKSAVFQVRLRRGQEERLLRRLRVKFPKLIIQVMSMAVAPGEARVEMIAAQTLRSTATRSLLAARPEMDLLVRLSGTRQISRAIGMAGYGTKGRMVLVAAGQAKDVRKIVEFAGRNRSLLSPVKSAPMTVEDLEAVETAALLGGGRVRKLSLA